MLIPEPAVNLYPLPINLNMLSIFRSYFIVTSILDSVKRAANSQVVVAVTLTLVAAERMVLRVGAAFRRTDVKLAIDK